MDTKGHVYVRKGRSFVRKAHMHMWRRTVPVLMRATEVVMQDSMRSSACSRIGGKQENALVHTEGPCVHTEDPL
eukprot:1508181-Pleurochrysis_carterae.AAC.1